MVMVIPTTARTTGHGRPGPPDPGGGPQWKDDYAIDVAVTGFTAINIDVSGG